MRKLGLEDLDVSGKRVLLRVDFNVPQNEDGTVRDDTRIRGALRSIEYIREHNGKLVLMSHLGRPKDPAKAETDDERAAIETANAKLKLDPVAHRLRELIGGTVIKADAVVGAKVEATVEALQPGDILLLENTRFHPGETRNSPELAAALAKLGDVYVSDAFGAIHRAHASTEGIAHHFKQRAAGFLLAAEIEYFDKILNDPERPLAAILGGAKVSDKIGAIVNLLELVDLLIIGGGMCFTFWKAQGHSIGDSLVDEEGIDTARAIVAKAQEKGVELLLPVDAVVADRFAADAATKVVGLGAIEPGWMGLDIGPETVERFCEALRRAKTVVWNGPLGVFEMAPFEAGTRAIGELLAEGDMLSVVGGGDTVAAIAKFGLADKMSHVSTGGGASLEMLEGRELPGLAVLTDAP
ncbi:MAG: phosphoglycerate kinase [Candidatus Hydrogenedentes bacterium]|nr:phosphoglycerate kinase [Candidatus Hydrogenedentota bacterium]